MKEKDLSILEDLSVGIGNLCACEVHLSQSFITSKDKFWLDSLDKIRKIRTKWMQVVFKERKIKAEEILEDSGDILGAYYYIIVLPNKSRNQSWCICKHLLISYVTGTEVATKLKELEKPNKSIFRNALSGIKILFGGNNGRKTS